MSLLDEIRGAVLSAGTPCRMQAVLASLDEADRADLEAALQVPKSEIPTSAIMRVLRKRGITVADQSVNRHRRALWGESGCQCPSRTS